MVRECVRIGDREVWMAASAAIPRLYRFKFRRDILGDMQRIQRALVSCQTDAELLDQLDMSIIENVAYVMAKHADPSVPETAEEWLDQLDVFSLYEAVPQIIKLWGLNMETQVEAKKNLHRTAGR